MNKGYTLVELLAVIALIAIILLIAVPQINNLISEQKTNAMLIDAKAIIREIQYENKSFENETLTGLGFEGIKYNNYDLSKSIAYIDDDQMYINLVGQGKFQGMTICGVTLSTVEVELQDKCPIVCNGDVIYAYGSISSPDEGYCDYRDVKNSRNESVRVFVKYPIEGPYSIPKSLCGIYKGNLECFDYDPDNYAEQKVDLMTLFGSDKCTVGMADSDYGQSEYTSCTDDSLTFAILNKGPSPWLPYMMRFYTTGLPIINNCETFMDGLVTCD